LKNEEKPRSRLYIYKHFAARVLKANEMEIPVDMHFWVPIMRTFSGAGLGRNFL